MPSSHLILCHPLLLLPPIPPSIRVFSNESTLHTRWPKYWSFSFSISPSNEHPGLISFRMDWLNLLAVQGTLKSVLQHHSSKAWILRCSAFFTVQLSHPYMTTGQTIALTMYYCVRKRAGCKYVSPKKEVLYMGTAVCMFMKIEKLRKDHIYCSGDLWGEDRVGTEGRMTSLSYFMHFSLKKKPKTFCFKFLVKSIHNHF